MGIHSSKQSAKQNRKKKIKAKRSLPITTEAIVRKVEVTQPIVWHTVWDILYEDSLDKWRKSQESSWFPTLLSCTKKYPRDGHHVAQYHFNLCHEVSQDKPKSLVSYQAHGTQKYSFLYNSNNLLEKTLNESTIQKVIPSTGGFVAFYFTYHSLDDIEYAIIPLFNLDHQEMLYFFVQKQLPFEPRGFALSPDSTIACLLLSTILENEEEVFEVQVYSRRPQAFAKTFHGPTFEIEYEVPGLQPSNGCPKIMFDPRYNSSKLGMINVKAVQNLRIANYFLVYDIRRKRPVTMMRENHVCNTDEVELLDAGYSPDGAWVHTLVGLPSQDTPFKHLRSLWIINSTTLQIIKTIDIGNENLEDCFVNFLPVYSKCTRKMVLRHRKSVKVYYLPPAESLRALCRAVILRTYSDDLCQLDTSQPVLDYLMLKPYM